MCVIEFVLNRLARRTFVSKTNETIAPRQAKQLFAANVREIEWFSTMRVNTARSMMRMVLAMDVEWMDDSFLVFVT